MAFGAPSLTALVEELDLPLADAAVDRVLLVHALEMSHDAEAMLREVWRVLAPGGRLLAVIPNRRGIWARTDTTPFGHGRPYSRSQITALLRETWFTPTGWGEALYVPPIARAWFLRSAVAWERTGATISAPFAGVHIVEATKQVYRAIPARRERRRLMPALEPALAPSTGGAARERLMRCRLRDGSIQSPPESSGRSPPPCGPCIAARAAMAPAAAMQREAVRLAAVLVAVLRLRRLRLRRAAGDEGRQGVDLPPSGCGCAAAARLVARFLRLRVIARSRG